VGFEENHGARVLRHQSHHIPIDEDGKLLKIYEKVKPAEHAQEIIEEFV
jgi:peroxiredoxin